MCLSTNKKHKATTVIESTAVDLQGNLGQVPGCKGDSLLQPGTVVQHACMASAGHGFPSGGAQPWDSPTLLPQHCGNRSQWLSGW